MTLTAYSLRLAACRLPGVSSRMGLAISRCFALCIGILLPIAELYRRSHQLGDITMLPAWIDDVLIGAFLLYGAWRTRDGRDDGRIHLTAAWAFMAGMVYASFFGQLAELDQADPSGASPYVIVAIKGVGLAIAVVFLWVTSRRELSGDQPRRHGDTEPSLGGSAEAEAHSRG